MKKLFVGLSILSSALGGLQWTLAGYRLWSLGSSHEIPDFSTVALASGGCVALALCEVFTRASR